MGCEAVRGGRGTGYLSPLPVFSLTLVTPHFFSLLILLVVSDYSRRITVNLNVQHRFFVVPDNCTYILKGNQQRIGCFKLRYCSPLFARANCDVSMACSFPLKQQASQLRQWGPHTRGVASVYLFFEPASCAAMWKKREPTPKCTFCDVSFCTRCLHMTSCMRVRTASINEALV